MQTPVAGKPVLAAKPRAVARPMRMPTKDPGPAPDRDPPHLLPATAGLRRALDLGQQGGRVARASIGA